MSEIQFKNIPAFSKGLNLFDRADLIEDEQLTDIKNLQIKQSSLILDTGYIYEAPGVALDPATGIPHVPPEDIGDQIVRMIYSFRDSDGIVRGLLFTSTKLYQWESSAWTEVVDLSGRDLDNAARGVNQIEGNATRPIDAVTFEGSINSDDGRSMVIWTNQTDVVHKYWYTGADWVCSELLDLQSGVGVTQATAVAVWNDSVFVAVAEEDAEAKTYKIRWSSVNNEDKWNPTVPGSSAGFYELIGSDEGKILALEVLGAYLIVYRERSIWRGTWVGSSEQTVIFQKVISNEGVLGTKAVTNMSDWHLLVGKGNVYRYTGGLSLEPIGDLVKRRIYDDDGILDLEYKQMVWTSYLPETDSLWIIFPVMDTTLGPYTYILRLHLKSGAWTERQINLQLTAMTTHNIEEDDSWANPGQSGTWLEENDGTVDEDLPIVASDSFGPTVAAAVENIGPDRSWLSQVFKYDFPYVFFTAQADPGATGTTTGYIVRYNFQNQKDGSIGTYASGDLTVTGGDAIPYRFATKNFTGGPYEMRSQAIQFDMAASKDHTCTAYYSINDGLTWQLWGSILTTRDESEREEYKRYKIWNNVSCQNIMFRIQGAGGNVRFGSFSFIFNKEMDF